MRIAAVDASVIGKWLLPGEGGSPGAEHLYDDLLSRRIALVGPQVLEHEITSMIWKAVRDGRIPGDESPAVLERSRRLDILRVSGWRTDTESLILSNSLRHSPFDCSYLAVALELGCSLYTADRRFISLAAVRYPCVKYIEDYVGVQDS